MLGDSDYQLHLTLCRNQYREGEEHSEFVSNVESPHGVTRVNKNEKSVPPHCAKLVEASSHLEVHTEGQVGTWQSLPELDVDLGDFTSDTSETLNPTKDQDREGEEHSEIVSNVESPHGVL